jgi:hypothetical protein
MRTSNRILAVTAAVLLLGASFAPAHAIDLNIGGIGISLGSSGNGGTTASVGTSTGGTAVSATLGGGSNLATAGVGTGGTGLIVGLGTNEGPLLTTSSSDGTTSANVNLGLGGLGGTANGLVNTVTDPLGNLLDGVDVPGLPGGGGGGGGVTPTQLASAFGGLGPAEQQLLRNRCRSVLGSPAAFEPGLVELCRIIARMQVGLN